MLDLVITQAYVQEHFSYNPLTGIITHRTNKCKAKAGGRAGSLSKTKSRYLRVFGKKELEHRIIWLYMTGALPEYEIDHIDQDRGNNRWNNLREVSHSENMKNKPKYKSNTTGVAGISIDKRCGKFRAYISVEGKPKGLGYFTNLSDAVNARASAMVERGYHANHGS